MIRAVYVGMAIGAASVEVLDGAQRLWLRRMATAVVAVVADARHAYFEQLGVVAAVRFVAVCAVFQHRGMLPQERTASLRVAAQAVFVRSGLNELLGIRRAVGVMTTGAGHFAFAIRHVR